MFDADTTSDCQSQTSQPSYHADVTTTAAQVAAEIRRSEPTARSSKWKLHKLLYVCQGHHLAQLGQPLLTKAVVAWDNGPVVSALWGAETHGSTAETSQSLDEAALNTVGYVLSRYGRLSDVTSWA